MVRALASDGEEARIRRKIRTSCVQFVSKNCTAGKKEAISEPVRGREEGSGSVRTSHGEAYRHEDPNKVVDNFEHGPFFGAKEFPGPRGKNESVPSGDGQRTHKKVLVGRQVGRELERVRKETCEDTMW